MLTLSIDSVFHRYGSRPVLKGAWLKAHSKKVCGVLGRNGCGKSTLLKILYGVVKADSATVLVNQSYIKCPYQEPGLIALLPQDPFVPGHLKVKHALNMYLQAPDKLLQEDPFLRTLYTKKVKVLSGGERRYFETVLVLNLNTHFVILDEPFTGIEPRWIGAISDEIQKSNAGIIITDHMYQNVLNISDSLYLIKHGQTLEMNHPEDLIQHQYLLDSHFDS